MIAAIALAAAALLIPRLIYLGERNRKLEQDVAFWRRQFVIKGTQRRAR